MSSPHVGENEPSSSSSSQFECNVCFDEAVRPVVTRCGHLYCWDCLTTWLQRGALDCPVCKAGVTRDSVIPLYGRGESRSQAGTAESHSSNPLPKPIRAPSIPRSRHQPRQGQVDSNIPFGVGAFPFAPFVGFSYSSGARAPHRMRLTEEESRQKAITQFFLFIGIVLIIMILSS